MKLLSAVCSLWFVVMLLLCCGVVTFGHSEVLTRSYFCGKKCTQYFGKVNKAFGNMPLIGDSAMYCTYEYRT